MALSRRDLHELSGLRPIDYAVLVRLAHAPWLSLPKSELRKGLYTTWSHLGKTIAGLERRGYVEREWDSHARTVLVKLTDLGWETWEILKGLDEA